MKRIEYENYESEYMRILGFWDEDEKPTESCNRLNGSWKNIRGNKDFSFLISLPEDLKDLLICPYERLVDYFLELHEIKGSDDKKLEHIFDENQFSYDCYKKRIAEFFKKNADKLRIHSCFYCDATYTGVFSTDEEVRRTFDVDHFFPKSEYPMFSLSLYNFVPSCQVCNSRVKGRNNFINFYSLNQKSSLKKDLLQISPISKKYDMDSNLTIKVYPEKKSNQLNTEWHYTPVFSKNSESYRILFDVNEKTAYKNVVNAFLLEERYNNIAIKSQALYLMDLKKKYPDSNIKFLSDIINQTFSHRNKNDLTSPEKIKRAIFHNDNKYSLLQKLRNDIVDYDIFDEENLKIQL